jgi:protein ImuA
MSTKADIISRLQKEILSLQGFKSLTNVTMNDPIPAPIKNAFPNKIFPVGAIHEFLSNGAESAAATNGFTTGLLSALMKNGGAAIWISATRILFPPALKYFGIEPDNIIFIDLKKERDILWAMEEALKCGGLAAVIGEMQELSFIASRRLQLAVEQSRVTGFVLRRNPRNQNTNACVTRWKITPMPSQPEEDLPGVGYPRWNVELLKVRNGKPGSWQIEWAEGKFNPVYENVPMVELLRKKTG